MNLHRKVGNKRQREWAWALVAIAFCTMVVAVWGSQDATPAAQGPGQKTYVQASQAQGATKAAAADTSIAGVLATIPEASVFNGYFVRDGVAAELGKGMYTIFVPTNSAFAALPPGTVSALSYAAQKRLVEYHVVSGKMLDTDAIASGNYQALSRDYLNFNVNLQTGASYVNSGAVIKQYKAHNGIIYTISSVLLPPR